MGSIGGLASAAVTSAYGGVHLQLLKPFGRLRVEVVSKLTLVQLQVNELWRNLRALTSMQAANVRNSLAAANPSTNGLNRMLVIFQRTPQGAASGTQAVSTTMAFVAVLRNLLKG